MLPLPPPETFNLTIDHLHDEPITLKSCCLVSKSWVPRARRNLFARVEINSYQRHIQLWMKSVPDPSNSPGHHTRILQLDGDLVKDASAITPTWVHHSHIEELLMLRLTSSDSTPVSFVQLRGLSPALETLHIREASGAVHNLTPKMSLLYSK